MALTAENVISTTIADKSWLIVIISSVYCMIEVDLSRSADTITSWIILLYNWGAIVHLRRSDAQPQKGTVDVATLHWRHEGKLNEDGFRGPGNHNFLFPGIPLQTFFGGQLIRLRTESYC